MTDQDARDASSPSAPATSAAPAVRGGHREHSTGEPRTRRASLYYDEGEWGLVCAAAALEHLKPGAFAARVVLDAARSRVSGRVRDREALVQVHELLAELKVQLAKIGGNLNDVAKHANSTHEVATVREQALAILERVRRRVNQTGDVLAEVRKALR